MSIIIADDSKLSRSYIKRILSVNGYLDDQIIEASNGQEALKLIESRNIKCIFLDINMPIMTGVELVNQLHLKGMIKKAEIVITSSVAEGECMEDLKAKGVTYFLRKPFSPEALTEITKILKGNAA